MKLAKWSVVAVAVMLFVACRGHEQTVAGGYGMAAVSGQVVMASGGSPAGVSVTVRGTGQTQLLAEDGRFSFSGVPENLQLIFTRADGIHATYSGNAMEGAVVIELGAKSAQARGRSRSARSTPNSEFEGLVKSASATELVLTDAHRGEVTIKLDANTVIRHGQTTIAATDIKAGDRVHARAAKQADNSYLASLVLVQNNEAEREAAEFEGIVKAISADSLTLTSPAGDVTLQLNASTTFTPAAPVAGDRVHVKATKSGDALVALSVRVQGGGGDDNGGDDGGHHGGTNMTANGQVTATGSGQITVESQPQGSVTVKIDANTIIKKQGVHIAAGDIKTGDFVNTRGTRIDDHSLLAEQIEVRGEGGGH